MAMLHERRTRRFSCVLGKSESRAMSGLSKIRFAQLAGRIAKNAADWSADSLDLIEDYPEMRPEDVYRFTDMIRDRLNWIDERAGRAALVSGSREDGADA
jgi:hypothetical protein